MDSSLRSGLSFGITSGIITTLGLMVGLHSGTHSKIAVMGGIITIAVADAFSDALGMHISQESETNKSAKQIWQATAATFIAKFFIALMFLMPVLVLDLSTAMTFSIVIGLFILSVVSFKIAVDENENPWKVVPEHVAIALAVIVITHLVGDWISATFVGGLYY